MLSFSVGLIAWSTTDTRADDPVAIPLEYVKGKNGDFADRLGIWVAINNGKAQRYIFDTGSDQLNTQIGKEVTGVQPVDKQYVYAYGDNTYGYKVQQVEFNRLTYVDPNDPSKTIDGPKVGNDSYKVGRIIDFIYTDLKDHPHVENADVKGELTDLFGSLITEEWYADLDQRALINQGKMAEEDGKFAGTFGAGDYLFNTSKWGMMGSATKTGYIVSANTDYTKNVTPGCSPCTIINLNPSLRAQFTNIMPWGGQNRKDFRPKFPGSGANASTELEGNYDFQFTAVKEQIPFPRRRRSCLIQVHQGVPPSRSARPSLTNSRPPASRSRKSKIVTGI